VPTQTAFLTQTVDDGPATPSEWWDRELFRTAEGPGNRCPEVIDVTGRPRHLFYGPYLPLGPGRWRAVAHLQVCADAARCRLAVEFGASPHFTSIDLPFGSKGSLEIEVTHLVKEAGFGEVRLSLNRAAFHGEVRFLGVGVERLGDLESNADA
jgi:hypothetical protein